MSYFDEVMADSPVVYYRMGEASGQPQDSSGNGLHTTATAGTPVYSQAGAIADGDTAILFDGTQRFTTPDNALLDIGDVGTWEAWFKRSRTGAVVDTIVSKDSSNFQIRISSDKLEIVKVSIAVIVASTTTITDTTSFHHLVVTKNAATVNLYIDGVDRTSTVSNQTLVNNDNSLSIASRLGGGQSEAGQGVIDELAIYATPLSAARVAAHWNAANEPSEPAAEKIRIVRSNLRW